ncbi:MAG TPA: serine/threonine-protein kinase [Planctomycetota bacterium]|nr:serine/threonine-protein kinase [Planctomycetota bacterium]
MEDQRMVQLALDNRMLTMEQVERAKKEQQALADRGVERSLWFLLLDLGFVNDTQARDLRKYVSSTSIRALEVEGYTLQGRIGSGGMGDVFRAVNAAGQEAAVKLLSSKLAKNQENARRFQREARASLRLKHPHITQSLAAGEVEGQRYLVMELIKGPSLKQRMNERGKLPEDQAAILLWQIASALRYAWNHGVLHRDVKPANLMLAPPRHGIAEPFCAKICDFGLAKVMVQDGPVDEESKGMLTGAGMALGTPHYMPPEQASGEIDLDQRADIYSLAASVYHALLGQTMHHGKSSTIIMYKQVTESADLDPLRAIGTSDGMVKLMGRMLEKSRKRRFNTWDEVITGVKTLVPALVETQEQALSAVEGSAAHVAQPAPVPAPAGTTTRRNESSENILIRPTVRMPKPKSRAPIMLALAVGALAAVAAGAWSVVHFAEQGQRVSPATFAVVLASVGQQEQRTLLLEPGDYPGPWRFGAAHAGVTIRATAPGVRVVDAGLADDVPLVRCEPGLTGFSLAGIELIHARGIALEAVAGARATVSGGSITGQVVSSGAHLALREITVHGGLVLDLQGSISVEDSLIDHLPAVQLRDGRAEIVRSRLGGTGSGPVVLALNGQLDLDAVVVAPANPMALGIDLGAGITATLRDVAVRGVATGVRSDGARLPSINGLSVTASDTGLWWRGSRDTAWSWERLRFDAPKPVQGLELQSTGDGARPERLGLVPQAQVATR